jgi:hypothetical protein
MGFITQLMARMPQILKILSQLSVIISLVEAVKRIYYLITKGRSKMELANIPLGEVGKVDIDFKAGQLVIETSVSFPTLGITAGVSAKIDAEALGKLIASKIPGQVDDAIIALIVQGLKAVP